MRVRIDPTKCRSYGLCAEICPEVFQLDEWGQSYVLEAHRDSVPDRLRSKVDEAVRSCPQDAISYETTGTDLGDSGSS